MKLKIKLANKKVPFKVTNFDVDFEERLGRFRIYADFSIDAINKIASHSGRDNLISSQVDYPYIISHPKLIYNLLDANMSIWLNPDSSSNASLFKVIMSRFRSLYSSKDGNFTVSPNSKWRLSSLSYYGVELEGNPSQYESNFNGGIIKLNVLGEFALRQI